MNAPTTKRLLVCTPVVPWGSWKSSRRRLLCLNIPILTSFTGPDATPCRFGPTVRCGSAASSSWRRSYPTKIFLAYAQTHHGSECDDVCRLYYQKKLVYTRAAPEVRPKRQDVIFEKIVALVLNVLRGEKSSAGDKLQDLERLRVCQISIRVSRRQKREAYGRGWEKHCRRC